MINPQTRAAKILVAEDQEDLREMISATLRLAGHRVTSVPDGEAALRLAQQSQPDLIILDMHMPLLTGWQVCEKLRADQSLRSTPILLISGLANDDEIRAGLLAGAQEYIRKPFELSQLMQRVEALLPTV